MSVLSQRRPWSTCEIEALRSAWARDGLAEARRVLHGRTAAALHIQAVRLGLISPRSWTGDEIDLLRNAYAIGGLAAAAGALPHRSLRSIEEKASRVIKRNNGLLLEKRFNPRGKIVIAQAAMPRSRFWTMAELRILREAWTRHGSSAAYAALPHRSRTAVIEQARRLKLAPASATQPWDRIDLEMLQRLYPQLGPTETARRMTWRTQEALAQKARLLGLPSPVGAARIERSAAA